MLEPLSASAHCQSASTFILQFTFNEKEAGSPVSRNQGTLATADNSTRNHRPTPPIWREPVSFRAAIVCCLLSRFASVSKTLKALYSDKIFLRRHERLHRLYLEPISGNSCFDCMKKRR